MNNDELKTVFVKEFGVARFKADHEGVLYMQKPPSRGFISIGKLNDGKDAEVIASVLNGLLNVFSDRDSICSHYGNLLDENKKLKRELESSVSAYEQIFNKYITKIELWRKLKSIVDEASQ